MLDEGNHQELKTSTELGGRASAGKPGVPRDQSPIAQERRNNLAEVQREHPDAHPTAWGGLAWFWQCCGCGRKPGTGIEMKPPHSDTPQQGAHSGADRSDSNAGGVDSRKFVSGDAASMASSRATGGASIRSEEIDQSQQRSPEEITQMQRILAIYKKRESTIEEAREIIKSLMSLGGSQLFQSPKFKHSYQEYKLFPQMIESHFGLVSEYLENNKPIPDKLYEESNQLVGKFLSLHGHAKKFEAKIRSKRLAGGIRSKLDEISEILATEGDQKLKGIGIKVKGYNKFKEMAEKFLLAIKNGDKRVDIGNGDVRSIEQFPSSLTIIDDHLGMIIDSLKRQDTENIAVRRRREGVPGQNTEDLRERIGVAVAMAISILPEEDTERQVQSEAVNSIESGSCYRNILEETERLSKVARSYIGQENMDNKASEIVSNLETSTEKLSHMAKYFDKSRDEIQTELQELANLYSSNAKRSKSFLDMYNEHQMQRAEVNKKEFDLRYLEANLRFESTYKYIGNDQTDLGRVVEALRVLREDNEKLSSFNEKLEQYSQ